MSFASKLGRVKMPPAPAATAATRETPAEASGEPSLLDALRAKMDAILGTSSDPKTPPVARAQDDLPFERLETPAGHLYRRTIRGTRSDRVGIAPIAPGATARADLLALLALDPAIASCDPAGALYLDTETTGLSGGTGTVAFLVGVAVWERDEDPGTFRLIVEQFLLKKLGEERPILEEIARRIAQATMLVTFNGKSFDLPLLRTRFLMNRVELPKEPPHLDLVHVARRVHAPKGAAKRSLKLTGIEQWLLGLERVGDIPGSEVAAAYLHWLRSGDDETMKAVVEHNRLDVATMAALVGIYGAPWSPAGGASRGEARLSGDDFAGIARTLKRAGRIEDAYALTEHALHEGESAAVRRARAELAKAMHLRDVALLDFETLLANLDAAARNGDAGDALRLELAKLYEHHRRDASQALAMASGGTGEGPEAEQKRRERLLRKAAASPDLATRRAPDALDGQTSLFGAPVVRKRK
jgi:hypothetical protein